MTAQKNWLSMLVSRAGSGANCNCTRTLTLTFVRTVDSRGAPRLLVEAGAAAVARLSAGVVLALALESGQKKGHVELAVTSIQAEVCCRYLKIRMQKL